MAAATLTEKGQIVIPAEIRVRYGLTAGTQVEFVDDNGTIRPEDSTQGRPVRSGRGLRTGEDQIRKSGYPASTL